MVDSASKLVYGDQIQIRMDPSRLDAMNRGSWGRAYLSKQAEKGRMLVSASSLALASFVSFAAAAAYSDFFLIPRTCLGFFAVKSFFDFGYQKGIIDDWESKIMVRIDK